mgnify:CR=1 FL=1
MRLGFVYNVVYKSRCIYIGSTWDFKKRLETHKATCYNPNIKDYKKKLYKFIRATDEWEAFIFTIIDTVETDDSEEDRGDYEKRTAEQYYIDMIEPTMNRIDAVVDKKKRRNKNNENNKILRQRNKDSRRFSCDPCGFVGKDQWDIDRHYTSKKCKFKSN